MAILYRCDSEGGNIRQISGNVEHNNTPSVLPDGRILYMRWEGDKDKALADTGKIHRDSSSQR